VSLRPRAKIDKQRLAAVRKLEALAAMPVPTLHPGSCLRRQLQARDRLWQRNPTPCMACCCGARTPSKDARRHQMRRPSSKGLLIKAYKQYAGRSEGSQEEKG